MVTIMSIAKICAVYIYLRDSINEKTNKILDSTITIIQLLAIL